MDTIINGVWTSEDSTGKEVNRYFFSPDGVYRYDVRLDDDAWHTARHGHYLYAEKMLSLQYSDGIWYNMGYVGADAQHMVQGFRRTAPGEGIEGSWRLDSSGMVFQNMQPCLRDNRITVSFADGVMNGMQEYFINGQPDGASSFSGKYVTGADNTIIISEVDNAPTVFLRNGQKTIYIIDDVLCPVDDDTIGSLFTRIPSEDWKAGLTKGEQPISHFSCYHCGGYVLKIQVAFKRPDELEWNLSPYSPYFTLGQTREFPLADIPGIEDGMDVRLHMHIYWGFGSDTKAKEYFTYRKDANLAACYRATGTPFKPYLTYLDYQAPQE